MVPSGTERRSAVQPRTLHIGLYCSLLVNCLPNCAEETRTPVVHIPSNGSEMPAAVAPVARDQAPPTPDEDCLERGASSALEFVDVLVPTLDVGARTFVDAESRVRIFAARTWKPSPSLRIGWIIGRATVTHPNDQLRSLLGTMGKRADRAALAAEDIALPVWTTKETRWSSEPIALLLYRTGIAASILPKTGDLVDLSETSQGTVPADVSALWTLGEFASVQLLGQKWMRQAMEISDFIFADYSGTLTFAAYAVEFRDAEGSLGCAPVFNRY